MVVPDHDHRESLMDGLQIWIRAVDAIEVSIVVETPRGSDLDGAGHPVAGDPQHTVVIIEDDLTIRGGILKFGVVGRLIDVVTQVHDEVYVECTEVPIGVVVATRVVLTRHHREAHRDICGCGRGGLGTADATHPQTELSSFLFFNENEAVKVKRTRLEAVDADSDAVVSGALCLQLSVRFTIQREDVTEVLEQRDLEQDAEGLRLAFGGCNARPKYDALRLRIA
jgi:hypothetical protein